VLVAATIIAAYSFSHRRSAVPTVRSVILPPPNVTLLTLGDEAGAPVISRDGSNLVFVGTSEGRQMLFLRSLTALQQSRCPERKVPSFLSGLRMGSPTLWRPDGKELYFVTEAGNLMAASVRESTGSIAVDGPRPLFRFPFLTGRVHTIFDVGPKDGQRFIGSAAPDTSHPASKCHHQLDCGAEEEMTCVTRSRPRAV